MKKKYLLFFSIKKPIIKILKNKNILIGALFLIFLILTILAVPYLPYDYNPYRSIYEPLQKVNKFHWMGTDSTGYDLFSQIIAGGYVTLQIGFCSVMISAFLGAFLGIIAGYYRSFLDSIINFICDILIVFPDVILAILIMCFWPQKNIFSLVIVLSISHIPAFIRSIRTNTMQIKENNFIKASRALGASDTKIIQRHILSHLLAPFITRIVISMGSIILSISSLGMIGMGLEATRPEWGRILFESKSQFRSHPHLFYGPFIVILLTSLSFNLLGKGLIQLFNPKEKH
ncbi:ABC transporter permease ['Santalum album' aster yellows phytoplasma]|uniref:ABC transporter permease n=1 Tax='Santalum album' aster yellows phytoplasma TaxID=2831467 RepID=A0ABS5LKB3_9MOLU|nr:ABC transporter permease ['Santalum album' aster yellows phytoplasma]MBS2993822.1 ABC transporter permease ['Santalum album' aster yellows phytoplasma]